MRTKKFSKIFLLASMIVFLSFNAKATKNIIKIKIASGSYSDEIAIRFMPGATIGFDGCCDAWKLFSPNLTVPNLFTKTDIGGKLSINALPPLDTSTVINLFVRTGTSGTYSVNATEFDSLPPNISIVLIDNVTGNIYDLKTSSVYTINLPEISINDSARFGVSFIVPLLSVGNTNTSSTINVYPSISKGIFTIHLVDFYQLSAITHLEIYNAFGNIVFQKSLNSALEIISLNAPSGIYIVRIFNSSENSASVNNAFMQKILITD